MKSDPQQLRAHFRDHSKTILDRYFEFLRFESISTDPTYRDQVLKCCEWVTERFYAEGFETTLWQTPGYATICAKWRSPDPDAPHVLIYGHYDVQPVDPLALWESPPFEPTVRDGHVYARGAQDNKGQISFMLEAAFYLLKRDGKLPLNVTFIIEGEEEIGSPGLQQVLKDHAEELRADYALIVDCQIPSMQTPAVTVGLRGCGLMSVTLTGSTMDLHSGQNGGLAYNPNHAMVEMLAKLHNADGSVAVPGFYDGIIPITAEERDGIDFSFDEASYHTISGVVPTGGEHGLLPNERRWLRPTLEINGIGGGYTGDGFKTVIPAVSKAKLSCRFVPGQNTRRCLELVEAFLQQHCPAGITLQTEIAPGTSEGIRTSPKARATQECAAAFAEVFGLPVKCVLEGWSVPVTNSLSEVSGADFVGIGLALLSDNMHAPNENYSLERIEMGFAAGVRMLERLGAKE